MIAPRFILLQLLGFATFAHLLTPSHAQESPSAESPNQPNVILIMADDLGAEAIGASEYEMPNLDRLRAEGVNFQYCWSTPLCTPSRVMLMTGLYGQRNYRSFGNFPKDDEKKTIGNLMREAGYATCMAGKWHVKGVNAGTMGFDRAMRAEGWGSYWGTENIWIDDKKLKQGEAEKLFPGLQYRPDMVVKFINDFIVENKDRPFFVYYPMFLVHHPEQPTPDSADRDEFLADPEAWELHDGAFRDMLTYMDKLIGEIVATVDEAGVRENTIILFTGDNGTSLHRVEVDGEMVGGGKGSMRDRGTLVPLIANWKGTAPEGLVSDSLTDFTDFFPTLAEIAGVPTQTIWQENGEVEAPWNERKDLSVKPLLTDGVSFLPVLQGRDEPGREWAFMHYKGRDTGNWPVTSGAYWARDQRYKLTNEGNLYDLENDRAERNPLPNDPELAPVREKLEQVFVDLGATPETIVSEEAEQAYKDNRKKRKADQK